MDIIIIIIIIIISGPLALLDTLVLNSPVSHFETGIVSFCGGVTEAMRYRGTSFIRNFNPLRTAIGP